MKDIRVKEFSNPQGLDIEINSWLQNESDIRIVDVKYQVSGCTVRALVMYTREHTRKPMGLEMASI